MNHEATTYLSPAEVCERFGGKLSARTLANWRSRKGGHGPEFVKMGGRVFYPLDKVKEWENRNTFRSTSEYKA